MVSPGPRHRHLPGFRSGTAAEHRACSRCSSHLVVLHTIHIVGIFKRHIAARRAPMHRPVLRRRPDRGSWRPRPAPETAHHAPRGPTAGVQGIPNDTTSGPVRRTRVAKNALRATYAAQRRPPRSGVWSKGRRRSLTVCVTVSLGRIWFDWSLAAATVGPLVDPAMSSCADLCPVAAFCLVLLLGSHFRLHVH